MVESQTLKEEAQRILWREMILAGKYGEKAYNRLYAMVGKIPERYCT